MRPLLAHLHTALFTLLLAAMLTSERATLTELPQQPYAPNAATVRAAHLEQQLEGATPATAAAQNPGASSVRHAWGVVSESARQDFPYVWPPLAGLAGCLGLLLALLWPRARLRSLLALALMLGAPALSLSLVPHGEALAIVRAFPPAGWAIAGLPWLAMTLVACAAFGLAVPRAAAKAPD